MRSDWFSYPFVNVSVLQLDESGTDGGDVALLIGESHSARPFRVLQLGVSVDSGVTHAAVQTIHDHRQLNCRIKRHITY